MLSKDRLGEVLSDIRESVSTPGIQLCVGFFTCQQPMHMLHEIIQLVVLLFSSRLLAPDNVGFHLWQGRAASIEALMLCVPECDVNVRGVALVIVSTVVGICSPWVVLLVAGPTL